MLAFSFVKGWHMFVLLPSDGIFISQAKYLKDLLKRFGLESCKPIGTPMITSHKLSSKDETPEFE